MRYAHLSPAHLKLAVNKGSLGCSAVEQSDDATVTKTVTCETKATGEEKEIELEPVELSEELSGGAGRVRTAASQFCRLLPQPLGYGAMAGIIAVRLNLKQEV